MAQPKSLKKIRKKWAGMIFGKTTKYRRLVQAVQEEHKDYEVNWTPICIGSLGCITSQLYDELASVGGPEIPSTCVHEKDDGRRDSRIFLSLAKEKQSNSGATRRHG